MPDSYVPFLSYDTKISQDVLGSSSRTAFSKINYSSLGHKEYELCENLNFSENQDQTTTETRTHKNKGAPLPPFPNASINH